MTQQPTKKLPAMGEKRKQRIAGSILHSEYCVHNGKLGWWIYKVERAIQHA